MSDDERFARFEELGEARVRDMARQWQGIAQEQAYTWIELQDRRRSAEAMSERLRDRRIAVRACWIAAIAMMMATIGAMPVIRSYITEASAWLK